MMDFLFLAAAETAATVAGAANAEQARWSAEQWRDLLVAVIGAIFAGFLAWQNNVILRQNVAHEENAQERAARRGDPKPERTRPFPGEKR